MTARPHRYIDTVTDPRLMEAAFITAIPRAVVGSVWHLLLESAAENAAAGTFTMTARRIAVVLVEPVPVIERVFAAFEAVGLTAGDRVAMWRDRYGIDAERAAGDRPAAKRAKTNAERQRAWRERRREREAAANGTKSAKPRSVH